MTSAIWDWFAKTDAGLAVRIAAGVAILLALAIWDFRRHRAQATRWKEYLFLLGAVGAAVAYGIINDQITSRISWEYFHYGKGLEEVLGPRTPPDPLRLSIEAVKVGAEAAWTAGLLIGVALLIANNPRPVRPQLPYRRLARLLALILLVTITCALLLGLAGYAGVFAHFSGDFAQLLSDDLFRPRRFMAVYGIHLGGYLGGLLGTALAVIAILRARRRAIISPTDQALRQ